MSKYFKFWPMYFFQIALLALGSLTNSVFFFLQSRTSFSLIPNSFPAFLLLVASASSVALSLKLSHLTTTWSVHLTMVLEYLEYKSHPTKSSSQTGSQCATYTPANTVYNSYTLLLFYCFFKALIQLFLLKKLGGLWWILIGK